MALAYCIHCMKKQVIKDQHIIYAHNGHPMYQGKCYVCGAKIQSFLTRNDRILLKYNQVERLKQKEGGSNGTDIQDTDK